ncbi:MAG TPA: hypothetical protein VK146_08035 [Tabrizicola sp.]|nr:hypothetical protein [Tabrizicola sp.]
MTAPTFLPVPLTATFSGNRNFSPKLQLQARLTQSVWREQPAPKTADNKGEDIMPMTASSILQRYLDDMGRAVMNDWFEVYADRIQLPLSILTSSANLTITTLSDLEEGFDEFTEMLRDHGVTQMQRSVRVAGFQGNDHVVGIYETRLLAEDRLALPAFHSKMWIGCYDGLWKAFRIHNTTDEARWPMLLTRLSPELMRSEEL